MKRPKFIGLISLLIVLALVIFTLVLLRHEKNSQSTAEQTGGQNYKSTVDTIVAKNPVISFLPVDGIYYRIDYVPSVKYPSDKSLFALKITITSEKDKSLAMNWFTQHKFNIADYEVIYVTDPLLPEYGCSDYCATGPSR